MSTLSRCKTYKKDEFKKETAKITYKQTKSHLDQKLCQFLFFHCDITFDKLSKLGKVSFIILYYIEIRDSLYLHKFLISLLENWHKMRKIIA